MRPAFQSLINQAEAAGWAAEEIESALLGLANDNIMHALVAIDAREGCEAPASNSGVIDTDCQGAAGSSLDDQTLKRLYA